MKTFCISFRYPNENFVFLPFIYLLPFCYCINRCLCQQMGFIYNFMLHYTPPLHILRPLQSSMTILQQPVIHNMPVVFFVMIPSLLINYSAGFHSAFYCDSPFISGSHSNFSLFYRCLNIYWTTNSSPPSALVSGIEISFLIDSKYFGCSK